MVKHLLAGTTVENVKSLHDQYGEVVRLSPNEVSFVRAFNIVRLRNRINEIKTVWVLTRT